MCSPGEVFPGSRDPGSGRLHSLPGRGGMWIVTLCLHTQGLHTPSILGGCSSSISVSCLTLLSALIATACTSLWSSIRWCSVFCGQTGKEFPLLVHPKTMVSCLLGRSRVFSGLPHSYLWRTSPLQAVFMQPTPVLSLGSDLRSPSLRSQPPPAPVGEQTSLSGW